MSGSLPSGAPETGGPQTSADVLLEELPALQRRLHTPSTIGELLSKACTEGARFCGFSRGIVLAVADDHLTTSGMEAIEDPACDALRRRGLAEPIPLAPGSEEAELIRRAEGGRRVRPAEAGVLKETLGLEEHATAPVVPERRAVALVVFDRTAPQVTDADRAAVQLFAHVLGLAVERLVLRLRMRELSTEFRHLTASAHALMNEALEAPVALTVDYGHGAVFAAAGRYAAPPKDIEKLLSHREREIAALMVSGLSNREIGDELHLSPDTVKAHVARLVRKLGASNRVEAVARYVGMVREPGP